MKIPTKQQREMNKAVMDGTMSIKDASLAFAVSPSTIRRAMDAVTEFNLASITLELRGYDWAEIIGWLRNGNSTSNDLAERIVADIEKQS